MGAAEYLNKKYHDFRMAVLEPQAAAKRLSRSANIGAGARTLTIFLFIAGLVGVILSIVGRIIRALVSLAFGGTLGGLINSVIESIIMFVGYFIAFIPFIIAYFALLAISVAAIWFIAKLLGGKSTYGKNFGILADPLAAMAIASSLLAGASQILSGIFSPVSAILGDAVSWIFGLASLALWVYTIYLVIVFTAEVNEFEAWKAAVAVLLPLFLIGLFAAVLVVIATALLSAAFLGSLGLSL